MMDEFGKTADTTVYDLLGFEEATKVRNESLMVCIQHDGKEYLVLPGSKVPAGSTVVRDSGGRAVTMPMFHSI